MLKIEGLTYSYGSVGVLHGIDLEVAEGEIIALIGANGAGKTTTMRCISGVLIPSGGRVLLNGKDLAGKAPHVIARAGIGHVLEGRHLFNGLTVRENLTMGAYGRKDASKVAEDLEWIYGLFPRVKDRLGQLCGTLSGGEQQMVAMARSLMARPKVLLLDEPSMGLAPRIIDTIFEIIENVASTGLPILLVEQNAQRALSLAHRACVLELGDVILRGTGQELAADEAVKRSYLGG